jgi:serine-threonine kinase receptor-associated protein
LQHEHIVKSVAFVPDSNAALVATGGFDKKLRIFDLNNVSGTPNGIAGANGGSVATVPSYEIGSGIHGGSIPTVVWGPDKNLIVTGADDKVLRWWDLRSGEKPITTYEVEGVLGSCELNMLADSSPQDAMLAVAAGKNAYFFSATTPGQLLKTHTMPFDVASVAVNTRERKFVVGGRTEQWVRVYDFDTADELNVLKGHHGPVWSTAFSPDGKICATGSEDGTIKLWKFTTDAYGLWR